MPRTPTFILAAVIAPVTLVFAQSASESTSTLPAVVVSGERPDPFALSITELPLSTAETTQIREPENLAGRVPNLGVSSSSLHSFGDVYSIRGLGNTPFFSSSSVAFYVDDVPGGDAYSFLAPLYNIERIDVFRGPQPTRFGLNGEAGAISIHSRRADPRAWHGEASASFGSYDTQEYRLSLAGPLVKDKLTLDLSGFWGLGTGFIDNTFLGNRRDDRDTLAGRAVLTWTPAPDWEISLGIEGARVNDGAQRIVKLDGDPFQVRSDVDGSLNIHQHREWLNVGKRFETWQVRSITSHSEWEVDPAVLDLDLSPARADVLGIFPGILPIAAGGVSQIHREQESWSQELRFESVRPAPLTAPDGKSEGKKAVVPVVEENYFRWNVGLFFQRKETSGDDLRSFSAPFVTVDPFFFQPLTIYTPLNQRTTYRQDEETWAGYFNVGYHWSRLDIDAGVRVDYTRKEMRRTKTDPVTLPVPSTYSGDYEEWTASPTVGLTFRATDNIDLFARTTWGFKPGGFSAFTDNPDLAEYDRETVWATEAGIRARAFDGKLRGQLTGYYHDIDDYQVERTFSFTDYLVVNAGHAKSRGVELELSWEVLSGLTFSGSIGYNQTELHDYRDPFTDENLGGNEAPYVPNFTALAALEYQHSSGFRAKVDYVAIGDTHYTDTNAERYRQAAYGVLNARIGFERENYGFYVFGRNLTDERYFTTKASDIDAGVIGEPRILGVMGLLKF